MSNDKGNIGSPFPDYYGAKVNCRRGSAIKLANCHSFLFNTHMAFEWDHEKSLSNLDKHGIDFENAKAHWKDVERVEIKTAYPLEERYVLIGKLVERFIKNVTLFCHCEERQRRSNLTAISRYWRLLRYARNDLVLVFYLSMFS